MAQSPRPLLPAASAGTPSNNPPTRGPPASAPPAADLATTQASSSSSPSSRARARRTVTLVACFECQKKKTKCDGQRPECGRCAAKGTQCMWETDSREQTRQQATYMKLEEAVLKLEDANTALRAYERLLHRLRNDPQDAAEALLQRLRSAKGPDADGLLPNVPRGSTTIDMNDPAVAPPPMMPAGGYEDAMEVEEDEGGVGGNGRTITTTKTTTMATRTSRRLQPYDDEEYRAL